MQVLLEPIRRKSREVYSFSIFGGVTQKLISLLAHLIIDGDSVLHIISAARESIILSDTAIGTRRKLVCLQGFETFIRAALSTFGNFLGEAACSICCVGG